MADAKREIKRLEDKRELRPPELIYLTQMHDKYARLIQEIKFFEAPH